VSGVTDRGSGRASAHPAVADNSTPPQRSPGTERHGPDVTGRRPTTTVETKRCHESDVTNRTPRIAAPNLGAPRIAESPPNRGAPESRTPKPPESRTPTITSRGPRISDTHGSASRIRTSDTHGSTAHGQCGCRVSDIQGGRRRRHPGDGVTPGLGSHLDSHRDDTRPTPAPPRSRCGRCPRRRARQHPHRPACDAVHGFSPRRPGGRSPECRTSPVALAAC
jgi:hypothetical protein